MLCLHPLNRWLPHQASPFQIRRLRCASVKLRPLSLEEAIQLADFNSPKLKAAASQVDQAKSALRAAIAAWYPTVDLTANGLPEYFNSYTYRNSPPDRVVRKPTGQTNPNTGDEILTPETRDGYKERLWPRMASQCRLQGELGFD